MWMNDRKPGRGWRRAFRVLDAVLPRVCLLCAAPAGTANVCAACIAELPRLPAAACPVCALPAPGGQVCGACLRRPPHFDATRAIWRYGFPLDRLIQALKYSRRLASADFFGQALLAATAQDAPPDLILPVPLSPQRLAERGFNQSVEIARPLARRWRAPLLLRGIDRRETPPQASLPWKERAKNIRHAFACTLALDGRRVLVVDDVMTTGATLDELARTLKMHGAARVDTLVLARTLRA